MRNSGTTGCCGMAPSPRRAPLRARDFVASDRVPRRRHERRRGARHRRAVAADRVAHRHVAQWANRPCKAQFAALRVTPAQRWPHRRRARDVWLLCERDSARRRASSTTSSPCRPPRRATPWCGWRISGGRSSSSTRARRRARLDHSEGRCFRLASPRRADGHGLQLAAGRTATRRCATSHAANRACGDHRDPHGAFLCDAPHYLRTIM